MKKWILKAIIQKTISVLPFSFTINYLFQKHVTKAVVLNEVFFDDLVRHFSILRNRYIKFPNKELIGTSVLELGTGWHPIIPILFFLCGSRKIVTIDLRGLIRKENLNDLFEYILNYYRLGKLIDSIPGVLEDRISVIDEINKNIDYYNIESILTKLNIVQNIGDVREMKLKHDSYDIISSVNVLEHVKIEDLRSVLATLYEVSCSGSFHYHSFGCYDHFYHVDKTISKFNYLRFSKAQWKLIDNNIQPQNRLRVNQFRLLFNQLSFKIKEELHSAPNLSELDLITVNDDFKGISKEECAVDYGTFILSK